MRLSPYQKFYCIVRIVFAIGLLQFVAANVEAGSLEISNVLISKNENAYLTTFLNNNTNNINQLNPIVLQSSFYLPFYSSMHIAMNNQRALMSNHQKSVENAYVISQTLNVVDIDKHDIVIDVCEECKCHGGHIIFTSSLNFVIPLILSVPTNTQNPQYWPPTILVTAKPPIV